MNSDTLKPKPQAQMNTRSRVRNSTGISIFIATNDVTVTKNTTQFMYGAIYKRTAIKPTIIEAIHSKIMGTGYRNTSKF